MNPIEETVEIYISKKIFKDNNTYIQLKYKVL